MLASSAGGDGAGAKAGEEKVYSGRLTDEMSIGDMVCGTAMRSDGNRKNEMEGLTTNGYAEISRRVGRIEEVVLHVGERRVVVGFEVVGLVRVEVHRGDEMRGGHDNRERLASEDVGVKKGRCFVAF